MLERMGLGQIKLTRLIEQGMQKEKEREATSMQSSQKSRLPTQIYQDVKASLNLPSKTKNEFELQVSSSSSNESICSNDGRSRTPISRDMTNASTILKSFTQQSQALSPFRTARSQLWTTSQLDKKRINFLKGLHQNRDLEDNMHIDEYQQNGKIVVKLQSKDFMTFMRWQHEVEELKRKKHSFDQQKENHQRLTKGDTLEKMAQKEKEKIIESKQKRFSESWIVGAMLAKRFLRNHRKKREIRQTLPPQMMPNRHPTRLIVPAKTQGTRHQTLLLSPPIIKWKAFEPSEDSKSMVSQET